MKRLTLLLVALAACSPPSAAPTAEPVPAGPYGVIVMIGDGAGLDYWSAGKLASSALAIEDFPVIGLVDTESSDSRITDSAAGATAYSAGVRTYNGAIGVGPDTVPVETVLEVARDHGWATGLVATSTVTHATPASFAAHVASRNFHDQIAEQMASAGIDVLLGGGREYFEAATREDGQDFLTPLTAGATYVDDAVGLRGLDLDTVSTLVGLFAEGNPSPAVGREPSLNEMTDAALRVLEQDRDGFFLMVEASQIDWQGHDNAPLRDIVSEVLDFDLAIRTALMFQEERPNTLVLVLADHSTGGLSLHGDSTGVMAAHYTTEGHTAGMIPMFARGPGADHFSGIMDNDQVGRLLLRLVREREARRAGL